MFPNLKHVVWTLIYIHYVICDGYTPSQDKDVPIKLNQSTAHDNILPGERAETPFTGIEQPLDDTTLTPNPVLVIHKIVQYGSHETNVDKGLQDTTQDQAEPKGNVRNDTMPDQAEPKGNTVWNETKYNDITENNITQSVIPSNNVANVTVTENNVTWKTVTHKYIDDVGLFELLNQVMGYSYISCKDRTRYSIILHHTDLQCSCEPSTCGISHNCCPDVDPDAITIPGPLTPTCRPVSTVLYTAQDQVSSFQNKAREFHEKCIHHSKSVNSDTEHLISTTAKQSAQQNNQTSHQTALEHTGTVARYDRNVDGIKHIFPYYLVFDTCPNTFTDQEIIEKCTRNNSDILDEYIPIYSVGGFIYKNIYCAECNSVGGQTWDILTDCLQIYTWVSWPHSVAQFLNATSDCTVLMVPPDNMEARISKCDPDEHTHTGVIDKCNVTGKWLLYYNLTETLCLTNNHMMLYHVEVAGEVTAYKNLFCYMCNWDGVNMQKAEPAQAIECLSAHTELHMPLYLDIPFRVDSTDISSTNGKFKCPAGYIQGAYQEGCIQFQCPLSKTPIDNVCVGKHGQIQGLVLGAYMYLEQTTDMKPISTTTAMLYIFAGDIQKQMTTAFNLAFIGCKMVHFQLMANQTEKSLQEGVFIQIKLANTATCTVDMILELLQTFTSMPFSLRSILFRNIDITFRLTMAIAAEVVAGHFTFNKTLNSSSTGHEVMLGPMSACSHVILNISTYDRLVAQRHIVHNAPAIHDDAEYVEMCYSDYMSQWLKEKYNKRHVFGLSDSKLYSQLGFASTLISIVSIFAVLFTYSMFSELRFLPGKLFMFLCVNLLLAQCFFAFGINPELPRTVCMIMGACIHVFWLATIFSMNSCLWLMLQNMQKPLHVDNRMLMQSKSSCHMFRYMLYSYSLPLVCCGINICLAINMYDDRHYGYGGHVCFISVVKLKLATFIFPIALVLLINLALTTLIICSVKNVICIPSKDGPSFKAQVLVFFKLATMTGLFWLFGFLYEFTMYSVFAYLFVILNGGHGFFLAWSFLLNKRVWNLYKTMYAKHVRRAESWTSSAILSGSSRNTSSKPSDEHVISSEC